MVSPVRVDAAVDLAYGALILLAIVLIATVEFGIGIAFGVGVFSAYVLHVVWKMARFDPDWMRSAVEDAVDDSVERVMDEQVGEQVEDSMEQVVDGTVEQVVDERVGQQVDETIGDQLDSVEARVEAVDERLDSVGSDSEVTGSADEPRDR
ncbi:hypothetical protein EGH22_18350 [Halomicroarcula sp. F28]|uniref:hypothetical protein n=1 Tax=Haloarcula salinisoli TaxID=2487746 RepID=UPI001C72CDD0|nr:hypothetical protein [Halomicroarcula salinisoli]MBX0288296.1 hypothetical protein [Halomicroarcula salinisoli]